MLLDAYRKASELRQEVSSGFDDISDAFTDIDFNVSRFPDDRSITMASEKLVFAILRAIEYAIGFYTGYQSTHARCNSKSECVERWIC